MNRDGGISCTMQLSGLGYITYSGNHTRATLHVMCKALKLKYCLGSCYVHEQVSCPLAAINGQPHAPLQQFTHKHKRVGSMQVSFGRPVRHTVFWPGFIRFEYCCASCMSLSSCCSPREPDLSTTRKLSHTTTLAAASKASSPDVTSCYMHLIFVHRDF